MIEPDHINNQHVSLSAPSHELARRAVLLTGSARSGTTILGKLLSTATGVEYFFEPPTLFSLFSIIDSLPAREARLLYDTYIAEEMVVGALTGRQLNQRLVDESCIYHVKSEQEIAARLANPARREDLDLSVSTPLIKVPDFVYKLESIAATFQPNDIIVTIRRPETTLASLIKKQWFHDDSLKNTFTFWPAVMGESVPIPHWVPESRHLEWETMSEVERAALYYVEQTSIAGQHLKTSCLVDYDRLLQEPREIFAKILERLMKKHGEKSNQVLKEIQPQKSTEIFSLHKLPKKMKDDVEMVYSVALQNVEV